MMTGRLPLLLEDPDKIVAPRKSAFNSVRDLGSKVSRGGLTELD